MQKYTFRRHHVEWIFSEEVTQYIELINTKQVDYVLSYMYSHNTLYQNPWFTVEFIESWGHFVKEISVVIPKIGIMQKIQLPDEILLKIRKYL